MSEFFQAVHLSNAYAVYRRQETGAAELQVTYGETQQKGQMAEITEASIEELLTALCYATVQRMEQILRELEKKLLDTVPASDEPFTLRPSFESDTPWTWEIDDNHLTINIEDFDATIQIDTYSETADAVIIRSAMDAMIAHRRWQLQEVARDVSVQIVSRINR